MISTVTFILLIILVRRIRPDYDGEEFYEDAAILLSEKESLVTVNFFDPRDLDEF